MEDMNIYKEKAYEAMIELQKELTRAWDGRDILAFYHARNLLTGSVECVTFLTQLVNEKLFVTAVHALQAVVNFQRFAFEVFLADDDLHKISRMDSYSRNVTTKLNTQSNQQENT